MLKNIVIFIIALLGFGMIRLPLQERILEQEKNAGLLEEPVNLSSSDYLEQQLAMVSLGGLRSLVAAVLSMEAFDCFLISDWTNLERRYNQITALAPHSDFYWDNGSWHLGSKRAARPIPAVGTCILCWATSTAIRTASRILKRPRKSTGKPENWALQPSRRARSFTPWPASPPNPGRL